MRNISFDNICINKGLWKTLQTKNTDVTIHSVKQRFYETGRFDAFACDWVEGKDKKPHFFWESDIAKWIEGVSYILMSENNDVEKMSVYIPLIDDVVDKIEKNQLEDGYFNIFHMVVEPQSRWSIRKRHELYCAGHMIEAAIAYKKATGKDKFLKCMIKYTDHIYKVFVEECSCAFMTPGHPEIELALIKLYKETGMKKYLELSEFFVNNRGNNDKDLDDDVSFEQRAYDQSHLPVREQLTAEGHSVRACYLYCAMADLARIKSDDTLTKTCKALFKNIIEKRMYITGGIGSTYNGEAFTVDYDLPNRYAYNESCAAISLAMFALRMQLIDNNSIYADIIERIIYNGGISGISLSGDRFFYENPLELSKPLTVQDNKYMTHYKRKLALRTRAAVFDCSCCPPNINRFFASIGDYILSENDDCIYVNQFMDSTVKLGSDELNIITEYPLNGKVKIVYTGKKKLAVRMPAWCKKCTVNGEYEIINGYMHFENTKELEFDFDMPTVMMRSATDILDNNGKIAIQRGPVVYCVESVDNGEGLGDLFVLSDGEFKVLPDELTGLCKIEAEGVRISRQENIYEQYKADFEKCPIKFIPYFAFANRGDCEMKVWVNFR